MFSENVKKKHNKRPARAAYTLVEVLVAMFVVGIMFTAVYAGITQSFNMTRTTQENLRAIQMLQDKTETIRLYTWDQVTNSSFIPTTFTNWFVPSGTSATNGGVMYVGTLSVSNSAFSEAYAGDLKLITVTVSWTSRNVTHQQRSTTLVSHYGLQNYIYN